MSYLHLCGISTLSRYHSSLIQGLKIACKLFSFLYIVIELFFGLLSFFFKIKSFLGRQLNQVIVIKHLAQILHHVICQRSFIVELELLQF